MASEKVQARAKELRAGLEASIEALKASDDWQAMLRQMAKFHRYSWNNQVLIAWQMPESTYVKGFKSWLDMGRCVRKGEKAIWILAPRTWKKEGDDGVEERGIYFSTTFVFDISQTDPIPGHPNVFEPPEFPNCTGDPEAAERLWNALVTLAFDEYGITVGTDPALRHTTERGWYNPHAKSIFVLMEDRPIQDCAATLIHELAHHVTHELIRKTPNANTSISEVIAEGVAFMVADRYGLDLTNRSAFYIAGWMETPGVFKAVSTMTMNAGHELIDVVDRYMGMGSESADGPREAAA